MRLPVIGSELPSRDLIRTLRTGVRHASGEGMPESIAWQAFLELKQRGEPDADVLFIRALRTLHQRRCFAGADLPCADVVPEEHKLTEDAYLQDLWKAYKKCIRTHRPGPAKTLLDDIEVQLQKAS